MLGYYHNEKASAEAIDDEGWYHSGDLGTIDNNGNLFIRGRIKNMLLGSNGQNIYPEEIEDKLNSMDMVNESVIVQRGDKLVGLVHPDYDEARELNLTHEGIEQVMKQNLQLLNTVLPGYCRLSALELHDEFEKTPKKSIKRFLYQEN